MTEEISEDKTLEEVKEVDEDLTDTLSIQTIERVTTGSTLKIRGKLLAHDVLLDNGSSHSFLDEGVSKWVKNQMVNSKPLIVMVANE